METGDIFW